MRIWWGEEDYKEQELLRKKGENKKDYSLKDWREG